MTAHGGFGDSGHWLVFTLEHRQSNSDHRRHRAGSMDRRPRIFWQFDAVQFFISQSVELRIRARWYADSFLLAKRTVWFYRGPCAR